MREIRLFELDQGQTVYWQSPAAELPQSLEVLQGALWLTVEGEPVDHWLHAGESFEMRAGQRVWLGTWREGVRLRVSQPTRMHSAFTARRPLLRGWRLAWRNIATRMAHRAANPLSRG